MEPPRPDALAVLRRIEQTHPVVVRAAVAEVQVELLLARLSEVSDKVEGERS